MRMTCFFPLIAFGAALSCASALAQPAVVDPAQSTAGQDLKDAGKDTANATKHAAHATGKATTKAYKATEKGTEKAYKATKKGTKKAWKKTKSTTEGAVNGAKQ